LGTVEARIELDYFFLSGGTATAAEPSPAGLIAVDRSTGSIFATVVRAKGVKDAYTQAALTAWILDLGHRVVTLQTDAETALTGMVEHVRNRLAAGSNAAPTTIHLQCAPIESHQSNGAAERGAQTVRALARTLVRHLALKTGATIEKTSPWWPWAIRHAAWLATRFQLREGRTAYERCKNKKYQQGLVAFGEMVAAHRREAHLRKSDPPLIPALWLGKNSFTDEHVVATKLGVMRCRTVNRLLPAAQWAPENVDQMTWTPWDDRPKGGRPAKASYGALPRGASALGS